MKRKLLSLLLLLFSCISLFSQNGKVNEDSIRFKDKYVFINFVKLKDTNISVANLTGKIKPSSDPNFVEADPEYAKYPLIFIREEVYIAFIKMFYAALHDCINLSIVSGFRNFDSQRLIWETKWKGEKKVNEKLNASNITDPLERASLILLSSAMPGTSRHHWGTDIDINSVEIDYWKTQKGIKVYKWLQKNALKFGFCQPYNNLDSERKIGYQDELWHWSFVPLSLVYMRQYKQKVKHSDINGFPASDLAEKLSVIENYVLIISTDCFFCVKY